MACGLQFGKTTCKGNHYLRASYLYTSDLCTSAIRKLFQTTSKAGLLSPDSVSVGFSIHFFDEGRENPVVIQERNEILKKVFVFQLSKLYVIDRNLNKLLYISLYPHLVLKSEDPAASNKLLGCQSRLQNGNDYTNQYHRT